MNKKLKGYELMKLIAEKQIKEGQEFLFTNADGVEEKIFWDGENFKYFESERDHVLSIVGDIEFAVGDFEILEDEEEIDIQGIKENYSNNSRADVNQEIINQLIRCVKQLDKKINKEEWLCGI